MGQKILFNTAQISLTEIRVKHLHYSPASLHLSRKAPKSLWLFQIHSLLSLHDHFVTSCSTSKSPTTKFPVVSKLSLEKFNGSNLSENDQVFSLSVLLHPNASLSPHHCVSCSVRWKGIRDGTLVRGEEQRRGFSTPNRHWLGLWSWRHRLRRDPTRWILLWSAGYVEDGVVCIQQLLIEERSCRWSLQLQ